MLLKNRHRKIHRKISLLSAITNSIVHFRVFCKCYGAYKKLICASV